jgi:hypothetical protein
MVKLIGIDYYEMLKKLTLVKTEDGGWVEYYINNATSEKWLKDHPYAEAQAGGAPVLTKLERFPWEDEKV